LPDLARAQGKIDPTYIPKRSGGQPRARDRREANRVALESSEDEMEDDSEDEEDMVEVGEEDSSEGESEIAS
jgi:hypothetical protein